MKRILSLTLIALGAFCVSATTPRWAGHALEVATRQSADMFARVDSTGRLPRSIQRGLQSPEDWTAGFFPGTLWNLYRYTGDSIWAARARKATALMDGQQFNALDHDIGFKMYCSFGTGYNITGDKSYEPVLYRSAKTLASRFSPATGLIMSWEPDKSRDWQFPVIIDNMMNLELLMEVSKMCGDSTLRHIAVSHADKTMRCQYRDDMSCPHVVDYDAKTGEVRKFDWNNGSDDTANSTWARGQAWGLYGFTMMYRETGDRKYLAHAERIADFLLSHPGMPADMIPYWDYTGAERSTMRDAAAAAVMASALVELSAYSLDGDRYLKAAEKQLQSLASPDYIAEPGTNHSFIIRHATGNYLRNSELDGALSYADYYFVEGLLRYLDRMAGRQLYHIGRRYDWWVEAHSPETEITKADNMIDIVTPKGLTMWYDRRLTGNYTISYDACVVMKGGKHDRLSDLNCFWGASDPDNPHDLYANGTWRQGFFPNYKTLHLFYVGYGGNHNRTTRFRKYYGGGPDADDAVARPVIGEYTDADHLLKANKWYHITISVKDGTTSYSVDGETLFSRSIAPGECDGYFGLRLLQNHVLINNLKITDK